MTIACAYRFGLHSSIFSPIRTSITIYFFDYAEDGDVVTSRDVVWGNQAHYSWEDREYQADLNGQRVRRHRQREV